MNNFLRAFFVLFGLCNIQVFGMEPEKPVSIAKKQKKTPALKLGFKCKKKIIDENHEDEREYFDNYGYGNSYYSIDAYDKEKNCKVGWLDIGPSLNKRSQWYMTNMNVNGAYQKKGIGTRLFKQALKFSMLHGAREMEWQSFTVEEKMDELKTIYERMCQNIQREVPGELKTWDDTQDYPLIRMMNYRVNRNANQTKENISPEHIQ